MSAGGSDRFRATTRSSVQPRERIGDYDIAGLAGRGATAEVYCSRRAHEQLAVKLFHEHVSQDAELRARVRRGAARAANLSHRHLLRVHGSGMDGDRVFVVTAWVAGTSLERFIASGRRASAAGAARTVEQLARAIAACHYDGVVHGALTPKAVLLDGRTDEALIDDLERPLSTTVGDHRAGDDHVVRDLRYTAPWDLESSQATPSGDVHALACILHAMLVGTPPARGGPQDRRVDDRIARSLRHVIARAISESAGLRYPSATALADDLEHAAAMLSGSTRLHVRDMEGRADRRDRRSRLVRRAARAVGAVLLADALLVALAEQRGTWQEAARLSPVVVSAEASRAGGSADPAADAVTTRPDPADAGQTQGTTTPGRGGRRLAELVTHLPTAWEPRPRRRARADTLTVDVPGHGRLHITYRRGHAPAPMAALREQRQRDRSAAGVEPLALRSLMVAGVRVAGYERRLPSAVQVVHRFRANAGQYEVVARAPDRRAAERLAATASHAVLRSGATPGRGAVAGTAS